MTIISAPHDQVEIALSLAHADQDHRDGLTSAAPGLPYPSDDDDDPPPAPPPARVVRSCPVCGWLGGQHDDDCTGDIPPLLRGRLVRRQPSPTITPADRAATAAEGERLVAMALRLSQGKARRCA